MGDFFDQNTIAAMMDASPHSPDETYDQWLVVRAQGGDREAVRSLYERWATPLGRHAYRLTRDSEAAADASQEAWLAIIRGIDRLQDPACFRRWAYQIVSRKCADWVRKQQRCRATTEPLNADPTSPNLDPDSTDSVAAVRQTLQELRNQDQAILAMHYADDMPLAEIAEAIDLPVGTVKSRLYHARQRLKQALERDTSTPFTSGER